MVDLHFNAQIPNGRDLFAGQPFSEQNSFAGHFRYLRINGLIIAETHNFLLLYLGLFTKIKFFYL